MRSVPFDLEAQCTPEEREKLHLRPWDDYVRSSDGTFVHRDDIVPKETLAPSKRRARHAPIAALLTRWFIKGWPFALGLASLLGLAWIRLFGGRGPH